MNDENYYCVSPTGFEHDIDSDVAVFLFSNQRPFREIAGNNKACDYEKNIIESPG